MAADEAANAGRPKRKSDWIGRKVRLLEEIETRGGTIFPKGAVMEVERYFGGLHLTTVTRCEKCEIGHRHRVMKIPEGKVELLPLET